MKTLRNLIRLDLVLLAYFGLVTATYTYSVTLRRPGEVYRFDQQQAPLLFLGTAVAVLAIVLYTMSGFALIGHRRRFGTLLAAGNLVIAVAIVVAQPSEWARMWGWIPALALLIMAMALAWASRRLIGPDDAAADLAALQIPDDIREVLLRQIGEAAAQEERNRLARDLHDSIKQQLFTINVSTAAAQELWERDPEKARGALADVRRSAKEALVEMQALLHQLGPQALASVGLVEAIREQCEALGYRTGAKVTLELGDAIPDDQLPPGAQETLFRIAQETLSNVARHARARNVRVWLGRESEAVKLRVEDDGQGFQAEQASPGMGLRNLKERAESLRANLTVTSAPNAGTTVEVRIPLTPPPLPETPVHKAIESERNAAILLMVPASFFLFNTLSRDPNSNPYVFYVLYALNTLLLVLLPLVISWRNGHRFLRSSSNMRLESLSLLRYETHRHRALNLLLAAWWTPWHWRLEEGWTTERYAWLTVAGVCMLFSLLEMIHFHRVSRFTNPFRRSSPTAYRFALFMLIGLILLGILSGAFFITLMSLIDLKDAQLMIRSFAKTFHPLPVKISFLASATVALLYTLTRQPRTEGVPS